MDRYTPNFVWKGANALLDYGLTIESELPEIVAKPRYNEITVIGSNRVLNERSEEHTSELQSLE